LIALSLSACQAAASSAPQPAKPLAMKRDGNNPLFADQSRFTIRLENTRPPPERNQRDAVDDSLVTIFHAGMSA
jgi:hypothetical protein